MAVVVMLLKKIVLVDNVSVEPTLWGDNMAWAWLYTLQVMCVGVDARTPTRSYLSHNCKLLNTSTCCVKHWAKNWFALLHNTAELPESHTYPVTNVWCLWCTWNYLTLGLQSTKRIIWGWVTSNAFKENLFVTQSDFIIEHAVKGNKNILTSSTMCVGMFRSSRSWMEKGRVW